MFRALSEMWMRHDRNFYIAGDRKITKIHFQNRHAPSSDKSLQYISTGFGRLPREMWRIHEISVKGFTLSSKKENDSSKTSRKINYLEIGLKPAGSHSS